MNGLIYSFLLYWSCKNDYILYSNCKILYFGKTMLTTICGGVLSNQMQSLCSKHATGV